MMRYYCSFLLPTLLAAPTTVFGFQQTNFLARPKTTSSTFQANAVANPDDLASLASSFAIAAGSIDPVGEARAAFALCFFGAVGSASLGRGAIPVVWRKYQLTQSLKGQGPSLGGSQRIELPLIAGYPSDLALADVQQVLESNLTAQSIVDDFPIPNRPPGYLTYEAFAQANPDKNPLALRAVFESLAVTSEIVTPARAQLAMETYKNDIGNNYSQLVDTLTKGKAISFSACAVLVVLLGLADFFALYHLYRGWFPDWPGAQNFPSLLFDPDVGILALPKYFIN